MAKLAASVYGEALYELAVESGSPKKYLEDAAQLKESLLANDEIFSLLTHPRIDKREKVKAMEDIYSKYILKDIMGLIAIVIEKDRCAELVDILDYFIAQIKEYLKIGIVHVATPMELTGTQKQKVEDRIMSLTDYASLEMNYDLDESLIGGMVIRIGDRVVDTSIKSKLAKLSKELYSIKL